jgi:hypothetical protein
MATTNTPNTTGNASAPTPNAWDQKELGCMWRREKQNSKEKYLTGVLNLKHLPGFPDQDVPIVVFTNKRKLKDTHPDLRVYLSEKRQGTGNGNGNGKAPARAAAPAAPTPPVDAANDLI